MSYAVLVENLRAAAGKYRTVAGSVGTEGVQVTNVKPDSLGHIELAAWLEAVADQCQKATKALHDGASGLADSLEASARYYENTDQAVGSTFRMPFDTGLLGPTQPAFPLSPASPPVYGPPVPTNGEGQ